MARAGGWERWLLPDRPGSRQFVIALVALLLPLPFLRANEGTDPWVLMVSLVCGCGLGAGWLLAAGWRWLRLSPATTVMVLLTCFASAGNLELIPRWDALVRAHHAADSGAFYLQQRAADGAAEVPRYATGLDRRPFTLDQDANGRLRCLYTGEPILRWSVRGWHPACFVVVLADGTSLLVRTHEELERAIADHAGPPTSPPAPQRPPTPP
jgi:hypothetical protein